MTDSIQALSDFLVDFGAKEVPHTNATYHAHAMSVYRDIKIWGVDEEVCRAAMFHSIYGTEGFVTLTLPLERREDLRQMIGPRAEKLAYANCAMNRASFYQLVHNIQDRYEIPDRLTQGTIVLTATEFDDLMRLHLCDFLEQVERTDIWDYEHRAMQRMSERLGGAARESYVATMARQPRRD